MPIKVKIDGSFLILINELNICDFRQDVISCSRPIDMDLHSIKNVMSPVNKFDAVNNAYAGRIKYKTATGNIPNTVMTDHTLVAFPAAKAFASGKIKMWDMWVERLADEWIAKSCPIFAIAWPGFHKFSRGSSLMTFFTGSPASGWTSNFRLDYVELPWVSLNTFNRNIIMLLIMLKW